MLRSGKNGNFPHHVIRPVQDANERDVDVGEGAEGLRCAVLLYRRQRPHGRLADQNKGCQITRVGNCGNCTRAREAYSLSRTYRGTRNEIVQLASFVRRHVTSFQLLNDPLQAAERGIN